MENIKSAPTTQLVYQSNMEKILFCKVEMQKGRTMLLPEVLKFINTNELTNEEIKELGSMFSMTQSAISHYIKKFEANAAVEDELGMVPATEYEFVNAVLGKWQATMTFNEIFTIRTPYKLGDSLYSTEEFDALDEDLKKFIKDIDPKELTVDRILLRLYETNAVLGLKYTEKQIQNGVERWMYDEKNQIIASIKRHVAYDAKAAASAEAWWQVFTESLTDKNVEETLLVLKHFVWQVKRKMAGKTVDNHMMPVLVGDQGIGKSSIMENFLKPITEFVAHTDFQQISDDRNHDLWDNYVLVLDEMSKADNSDINVVKKRITEKNWRSRILATNISKQVINKATFIGASNRDTSRLIFDDTGMRRFYQIDCLRKFNWDVQDKIDFESLWKSIDEEQPSPLQPGSSVFSSIKKIQDQKRRIGPVEQFLLERDYKVNGLEKLQAATFYKEFAEFELTIGPRNEYTATRFGTEVMDIYHRIPGLSITKKTINGKNYYFIDRTEVAE